MLINIDEIDEGRPYLENNCDDHLVRFPDPPYGVGRENEAPRSWEKNFGVT